MKKLLLLVPFVFAVPQLMAADNEVQDNYKKHYSEQVKPLVIQKLSRDRPDMSGEAIKAEAEHYAAKMAECQLEGLSYFPEEYSSQAIQPVANGESVASTTAAFSDLLKKDIDAGKLTKENVNTMIQNAQQAVQLCVNS